MRYVADDIDITADNSWPSLWNFDGSSTGQATTESSECWLYPVFMCVNPFVTGGTGFLVLCSVFEDYECTRPARGNWRYACERLFDLCQSNKPWFGFEQEYFMMSEKTQNVSQEQGKYYCGVGADRVFHRDLVIEHANLCIQAGLDYYGYNAEVAPGQWEFQIGTTEGIAAADHLLIARYILLRAAESHGVTINFHPKPFEGINGSGCHTNFSTVETRETTEGQGITAMEAILKQLETTHTTDILYYGDDNHKRLSGKYETSDIRTFTWDIASRNTSVRIGYQTLKDGGGYFEDRRPAANMNPYLVCSVLLKATMEVANRNIKSILIQ
jgi:glutamine synthetase